MRDCLGSLVSGTNKTTLQCYLQYKKIKKRNPETFYPFVFTDTMDLQCSDKGILVKDLPSVDM